jgi:hypothetical protein
MKQSYCRLNQPLEKFFGFAQRFGPQLFDDLVALKEVFLIEQTEAAAILFWKLGRQMRNSRILVTRSGRI